MDLGQSSILRVPTCVWWDEFWRGAVEDERRSRMFWKACMSGIEEVLRFAGEADSSTGFWDKSRWRRCIEHQRKSLLGASRHFRFQQYNSYFLLGSLRFATPCLQDNERLLNIWNTHGKKVTLHCFMLNKWLDEFSDIQDIHTDPFPFDGCFVFCSILYIKSLCILHIV